MLLISLILVHIVVVAIFCVLFTFNLIKIPGPFLAVVFWVPVFGPICALVIHAYFVSGRAGAKYAQLENMKASLVPQDDEPSRVEESVNDIPLEDALILDDPAVRRSVMLDVLMENNYRYVNALSKARLNDDVEVVHYATTAMAEFSKEYELRLQQYASRYAQEPANEALIEEYASYLSSYIGSVLCVGYGIYAIGNVIMLILMYFTDYEGAGISTVIFAVVSTVGSIYSIGLNVRFYGFAFAFGALAYLIFCTIRLYDFLGNIPYHILASQPMVKRERRSVFTYFGEELNRFFLDKYRKVRQGNAAEGTDHTWEEINTYSAYEYRELGIDRYKVAGLLQVGDENGPVFGEFGYGETAPNATVNIRGQTSTRYDQKNYKIEIKDNRGDFRGQTTIALNKHQMDGLRFRNKLCFDLMTGIDQMMSLRTQFVHLYVNDLTDGSDDGFEDKEQYDTLVSKIPYEPQYYYQEYLNSLEKPQPFFIGDISYENGILSTMWDPSYDFDQETITYTVTIARDYELKDVIATYSGVWTNISQQIDLEPGSQYFLAVTATNESGYSQGAFDYYIANDSYYYGMKSFYLDLDGSVIADFEVTE